MRSAAVIIVMICAALGLAACSGARSAGDARQVAIAAPASSVRAGDFVQLSATTTDAAGRTVANPTVIWKSSDVAVAKVTAKGLLLALGPGTVTLTAAVGQVSTTRTLAIGARDVPAGQLQMFLGPEETVLDYASQRCADSDVPDVPAHAVRTPSGDILLLAVNDPQNFTAAGKDFDHLAKDCRPIYRSRDDVGADTFRNREWLSAIYRVGATIYGLTHNEYHDPVATGCKPGDSGPGNPCWYNSVTGAVSTDGGRTFQFTGAVAPAPLRWNPSSTAARTQPHGYFNPSNIVLGKDGFYYALIYANPDPSQPTRNGVCVVRTANLADNGSWRAWNGSSFSLPLANPYLSTSTPTACKIVSPVGARGSLTFNTYLNQYMAVDSLASFDSGSPVCGFYYSLSPDLITWSRPRRFKAGSYPTFNGANPCPDNLPGPSNFGATAYASVIDHDSPSINFETAGQTYYVYFTRFVSMTSFAPRNLIRMPVILLKGPGFIGDVTPPQGFLDLPAPNQAVSGVTQVSGWAFDNVAMSKVEIVVDGVVRGEAIRGLPRPDIPLGIPGAPGDTGFQFLLDTSTLSNGPHTVIARAIDTSGNILEKSARFIVSN